MMLGPDRAASLRVLLDECLVNFRPSMRASAMCEDPVGVVYPFSSSPKDAEVVALLASSLAYGQRKVFVPILSRLIGEMGASPYSFLMEDGYKSRFDWFKYRFNTADDLRCLLFAMKHTISVYGSLESAFVMGFLPEEDSTVFGALSSFVSILRGLNFSPCGLPSEGSPGLAYLLPDPRSGGACKRLNMYLRWMLRRDEVDLGLWTGVPADRLIIPLDTHVQAVSLKLGLTQKKGSTWSNASDITSSLRQLDPKDPLKYDFLLFSLGVGKEL